MKTPITRLLAAGLCLALLSILFGSGMGLVFGAAEDTIKAQLAESGQAALETAYAGDSAAKDKVVAKSWIYLKRAHLHGAAIGTSALACILLLLVLGDGRRFEGLTAVALGAGALLYGVFWLLAGFAAPGAGSTGAAKEIYEFVALPGAGLSLLGVLGTISVVLRIALLTPKARAQ